MARFDLKKEKDVQKLSSRIRYAFSKLSKGIGNADECVQEILLGMLEGKHQHQSIDQAVIDYLRTITGRKGMGSYTRRQALELADHVGPSDLERLLPVDPGGERNNRVDFDECLRFAGNQVDRAAFGLFYKWGLSETEIGYLFGFSESRASQRLARVSKCLSERIKAQESRASSGKMACVLRPETERQLRGMGEITFERMETGESFSMASFNEKSF